MKNLKLRSKLELYISWSYFMLCSYYQFFFFNVNFWPWIRLYDRSCLSNSWNRRQRQWPSYTIVYACRTNRPLATYKIITEILRTPPLPKRWGRPFSLVLNLVTDIDLLIDVWKIKREHVTPLFSLLTYMWRIQFNTCSEIERWESI